VDAKRRLIGKVQSQFSRSRLPVFQTLLQKICKFAALCPIRHNYLLPAPRDFLVAYLNCSKNESPAPMAKIFCKRKRGKCIRPCITAGVRIYICGLSMTTLRHRCRVSCLGSLATRPDIEKEDKGSNFALS
jgi:hypothetical protein